MGTPANITVGSPATVKIGAHGGGSGAAVDVGILDGGLRITSAPEWYWHKGDQYVGDLDGTKFNEVFTAEFVLAEASQVNLPYAFGYPTTAQSGGTFDVGGNATRTLREIFITGNGPSEATRLITVHKCIITGVSEYAMTKDGQVGMRVEVRMIQDTAKSANKQYFSVVDSGGDTTPPTVAMTDPVEDAEHPSGDKGPITLTFTEADSVMDEGSIVYGNADNATIFVNDITTQATTALVPGAIVYNAATKTLTFTPTDNWETSKKMQIIITTSVRDTAGNHMADTFYGHFTTAA